MFFPTGSFALYADAVPTTLEPYYGVLEEFPCVRTGNRCNDFHSTA